MLSAAATAGERPVVLVLGDSLSAGYGIPLDQGWVGLLRERLRRQQLPHRVVNASISGDTTAGGLTRLPALLDAHEPAVVVIELGANDGLRGLPPAQIEQALGEMAAMAQSRGARVLMLGVRLPPNYGAAYAERFQQSFVRAAASGGAVLVPQMLAGVAERPELMQADGLHPTADAQPRVLDNLWPELLPLLEMTALPKSRPARSLGARDGIGRGGRG